MEGVTILNSYDCGNDVGFIVAIVILIILGLITLISFIDGCLHGFCDSHVSIWMTCFCIGLFFGIMALATYENPTYYEVLIDDKVSMTEFTQRYEIVQQNGQIFTIKEK